MITSRQFYTTCMPRLHEIKHPVAAYIPQGQHKFNKYIIHCPISQSSPPTATMSPYEKFYAEFVKRIGATILYSKKYNGVIHDQRMRHIDTTTANKIKDAAIFHTIGAELNTESDLYKNYLRYYNTVVKMYDIEGSDNHVMDIVLQMLENHMHLMRILCRHARPAITIITQKYIHNTTFAAELDKIVSPDCYSGDRYHDHQMSIKKSGSIVNECLVHALSADKFLTAVRDALPPSTFSETEEKHLFYYGHVICGRNAQKYKYFSNTFDNTPHIMNIYRSRLVSPTQIKDEIQKLRVIIDAHPNKKHLENNLPFYESLVDTILEYEFAINKTIGEIDARMPPII